MTPIESQFYGFALGLVNLVMTLAPIGWPFVIMGLIVYFIRRAFVTARGERDYDSLLNDLNETQGRLMESSLTARRHIAAQRQRHKERLPRAD